MPSPRGLRNITGVVATIVPLLLLPGCRSIEAARAVRASADPYGVIRLTDGQRTNRVDVRDQMSGCFGELYDSRDGLIGFESGSLKILDVATVDRRTYVFAVASAKPNCDIQGPCGKSDRLDTTLIWLNIAPDLTVSSRQLFAVDDCRESRSVVTNDKNWARHPRLANGALDLTFREGRNNVTNGRALYEKGAPAVGIQIVRTP